MKNLFDYATKELSQDAFLRWLFENYNCDNESLRSASCSLLTEFCELKTQEEIIAVETKSQVSKIDVYAYVTTTDKIIHLFIEDKSFSEEHDDQLKKYSKYIQSKYGKEEVRKVFYKTSLLSKKDILSAEKNGWKTYGIHQIFNLFCGYEDSDCLILNQYAKHIIKIKNAFSNTMIPASDEELYLLKWIGFFHNVLKKISLNENLYLFGSEIGAYNYAMLWIKKRIESDEKVPYLELRSRDIKDDGFSVTFLCYGVDYKKDGEKIKKVCERIKTAPNGVFISKNRRTKEPKQLGRSIRTSENVIDFLKKCIQDYDFSMSEW